MKETQLDFDKDFESDEEAMAFVDEVVTEIANSEASTSVTIPERVKRVEVAYKALRLIAKGKDVDVTYELNAPYTSMGSVSIVGKEVIITNLRCLQRLLKWRLILRSTPRQMEQLR